MTVHEDIRAAAAFLSGLPHDPTIMDVATLTECLYAWYVNPVPLPTPAGSVAPMDLDPAAALRTAHAGSGRFEGGWRAERVSTFGRVLAVREGQRRMVGPAEYVVPAAPLRRPEPGDALMVSACWDWVEDDTGYWYARHGEWPPPEADALVRIYFNCVPHDAPQVVGAVTKMLAGAPDHVYTVKTPAAATHNGRADAVVLYLAPASYRALAAHLTAVGESLAPYLRDAVPRLTFRLVPGMAMSESTPDGDSFGRARSESLARAFLAAGPATRASLRLLAEELAAGLRAEGVDPAAPHLAPRTVAA